MIPRRALVGSGALLVLGATALLACGTGDDTSSEPRAATAAKLATDGQPCSTGAANLETPFINLAPGQTCSNAVCQPGWFRYQCHGSDHFMPATPAYPQGYWKFVEESYTCMQNVNDGHLVDGRCDTGRPLPPCAEPPGSDVTVGCPETYRNIAKRCADLNAGAVKGPYDPAGDSTNNPAAYACCMAGAKAAYKACYRDNGQFSCDYAFDPNPDVHGCNADWSVKTTPPAPPTPPTPPPPPTTPPPSPPSPRDCGADWGSAGTFTCEAHSQHQMICDCLPPHYDDPAYWTNLENGCYTHFTGRSC
jgi:hypothetical protein